MYRQFQYHCSSIDNFMEKQYFPNVVPLKIEPEILRKRQPRTTYLINKKKRNYLPNATTNISANISTINQIQNTSNNNTKNNSPPHHQHRKINWLKYNILVGIYQNWIRLYPFIIHLLNKQYQHQTRQQIRLHLAEMNINTLSKTKKSSKQTIIEEKQLLSLIQILKTRKKQILENINKNKQCTNNVDDDIINIVSQLAKQLLSTLPIQSSNWTRAKIEKHNRILKEAIEQISSANVGVDSQAVIRMLKQRLQFVDKIQQIYSKSRKKDTKLKQKIKLMKIPLKDTGICNTQELLQSKLQYAWQQLKKDKQDQNIQKFHEKFMRYTVEPRSASNSLTIKYKSEKSSFFNESYIKSKNKKNKAKKKRNPKIQIQHPTTEQPNLDERTQPISIQEQKQSSINSSQLDSQQQPYDLQLQVFHQIRGQSFLKKRCKPLIKENSTSLFSKQKTIKRQTPNRPSISNAESIRPPRQSIPRTSFSSSRMSIFSKKQATEGRISISKFMPSSAKLEEQEQEDRLSRFKSHKKIGTNKYLASNNRRVRVTKQNVKNEDRTRQSNFKSNNTESRGRRKQPKKYFFDTRKANIFKKGAYRKHLDSDNYCEDINNCDGEQLKIKKQQILDYLMMIKAKGLLNSEKYQQLKAKAQELIQKQSQSSILANRQYAKKMEQKSISSHVNRLPDESMQERSLLLQDFHKARIQNEKTMMNLKDDLRLLLEYSYQNCLSDISPNQQYVLNSTKTNNQHDQRKRIKNFNEDASCITFANYLARISSNLQQKMVP